MATRRYRLTPTEQRTLWAQFKAGTTMARIADGLGRHPGTVQNAIRAHGGYTPAVPHRATTALTPDEREVISRGLADGQSARALARALNRAPSTVTREIARNGGPSRYRAVAAEAAAWQRAARPQPCRLATHGPLRRLVAAKLAAQWSPAQITGWLRRTYPTENAFHVSHETIYRSLFVQARGVLKKELVAHLRCVRAHRGAKTTAGDARGQIKDAVAISERPAAIEDRALPGHWEGDLLMGLGQSVIATLVERHSRYVHLVQVPSKATQDVVDALIREVARVPGQLMTTLTWDRGHEMQQHRRFSVATNVAVYFCDPRSPWQRGSNENTNGLLRQYFPKGTDLRGVTQRELDQIARRLNTRPRKTLDFQTPAVVLAHAVALTG
ncbi:IS30 family transposase [Gemmatimonas groenlandica]|uniref:IS30 family transposase n=1 Tax=Gemmatimonas groenlandica TaxID=2732249 RepID=A0A6M4IIL7_9BACT|nr:IS30 family transposase [Gemmatimonas groenlandica]QJR34470.1 IS30 family transposase [Gemmatimonas groenlandica]